MTETTFENYQERAARTIARLGSNAADGAHMALGITTETEELKDALKVNDFVNAREEHGDTNWYIANECNIYGLDFEHLMIDAKAGLLFDKIEPFELHNIVDLHKRELAYGKEMDVDALEAQLVILIQYLILVAERLEFSYEDSLKRNIDKLYKRYPDKFSQENALNRDLEEEHKTLKD